MKEISLQQLNDNFIEAIGHEWMLVTAGSGEAFNTMTASWGGVGYLWNRPVAFVFIRPERYTFEFLEREATFSLSFLGPEHKDIHNITGSRSGRDIDKVAATGLRPVVSPLGNILFEQSRLSLECRKLYVAPMREDAFVDPELLTRWYGAEHGGLHQVYVAEILAARVRE